MIYDTLDLLIRMEALTIILITTGNNSVCTPKANLKVLIADEKKAPFQGAFPNAETRFILALGVLSSLTCFT